ncbi:hypothetical protein [Brevibacterium marinum]|uniref:Uncharacterized protein n=1 Tax=Brevibacterium marinum TaxID=418643 RepID=A0A846RNG0_9MICO|nr:hypothetical protein [Brevibacterium marinum]NJC55259.1 hypothetical protein [Brevibacterium marinum]
MTTHDLLPAQAEPVFTKSVSSHDAPTCAHMKHNSTIHYRKMYH